MTGDRKEIEEIAFSAGGFSGAVVSRGGFYDMVFRA